MDTMKECVFSKCFSADFSMRVAITHKKEINRNDVMAFAVLRNIIHENKLESEYYKYCMEQAKRDEYMRDINGY